MKQKQKRAIISALAFLIPGLVMLWIYASLGFAPWGDKTVLVSDMSSQNVDFFCALKNGDLFFSWSKALGSGYLGVFSWFVSSPLSFLTLLVPNEAMPVGLMFLTVLKVALSGLTFSIFAQRRFPGCGIPALICAVCYALMSYNAAYSILIMWLDGVIWLPLILLAVERILVGRGAGPFIAALAVCFISTWYISYMIGIFCVMYLCVRLVALKLSGSALIQVLKRFWGGAACALGLTAWMWLPVLLSTFQGKFSGVNFSWVYTSFVLCNPILLVGQLLPGRYGGITNYALPYIFCGAAVIILVIIHFSFWDPYKRDKLAERVVLVILALSMILSPLDKVWHLFQRPNWFPYRYSFLFSFYLLYLALQALIPLLETARKKWGKQGGWAAALLLAALTVVDMGLNARGIINGLQEEYGSNSYQAYQDYYTANAQLAAAARADAGDSFVRIGAVEDRGLNTPLAFGYPGITHYSSFYNYDVNQLLRTLGLSQGWYECAYIGSNFATDALLDVGYVISRTEPPGGYRQVAQAGGYALWKTPDTLPLAFLTDSSDVVLEGETPFQRQNSLYSSLLGENIQLFTPVFSQRNEGEGETTLTFPGTGRPVYAFLSKDGAQEVLANGNRVSGLAGNNVSRTVCLGVPGEGDLWTVTLYHVPGWVGELWECDLDAIHAAVSAVDRADVASVGDAGQVQITVAVERDRILATTIPAENSWVAYVDGERAEIMPWLGAFLSLKLPAGTHNVELRYTAPGLIPGAALGVVSAFGLALTAVLSRRKQK